MRLYFRNSTAAKQIAKSLSKHAGGQLAFWQNLLAKVSGYRDWHELNDPSNFGLTAPKFHLASIDQQVDLVIRLSENAASDPNLIQFALNEAQAFQIQGNPIVHALELAAKVFRRTSIPDKGILQPGSVGISTDTNQPVILRKYGRPTKVITNKHPDSIVADFEFLPGDGSIPLFIPRRLYLVYGMWIEADGAKVLYSRDYKPMWRLRDGKRPERLSGDEYIDHVTRVGCWDDTSWPWTNDRRYREELDRLTSFGIRGLPSQVDKLPALVFTTQ